VSFRWTDRRIREALGLNPRRAQDDVVFSGISTDSRSVGREELFVALSGENYDGHDFVTDAMARGAAGAVVSRAVAMEETARLYPVEDTLVALGRLAAHRRRALGPRVVAVTGSSGKTTVKDLLREVLTDSFRIHATPGNLNNRIGLPLTILAAPADAEVLVLEMGTNEPGEIRALTEIAEPEVGIIVTVSESHLEMLGSLEGVLEEKLELFRGLPAEGFAVVGDEPPILATEGHRACAPGVVFRVAGWSRRADAELRPEDAEITEGGCFRFRWQGEQVGLRLPGRHSVQNALLALAVARIMGIPAREAAARVGGVAPSAMRSEIRTLGTLTVVVDCYNANPQSVRAALDLLETIQQLGPRVAVLGSMLELGSRSRVLHREALEEALRRPLDTVVATGLFAEAAGELPETSSPGKEGPELLVAPDLEEVGALLETRLEGTETLLLKASRGVAMERLVPALEERFGGSAPAPGCPGGSGASPEKATDPATDPGPDPDAAEEEA
jgi:UDP-N-acetylmuramoyl-tripeptide--D-alanyl-D-alanine ligase